MYELWLAKGMSKTKAGTVDLKILQKQYVLLQRMTYELELERRIRSDEVDLMDGLITLLGEILATQDT